MKNTIKLTKILSIALVATLMTLLVLGTAATSFADENTAIDATEKVDADTEESVDDSTKAKAIAAGAVVAVVATAAAVAMGMSICKSTESIARQPEADGKIRSAMMLGLVFIETVVIYALIVAILIIFVL